MEYEKKDLGSTGNLGKCSKKTTSWNKRRREPTGIREKGPPEYREPCEIEGENNLLEQKKKRASWNPGKRTSGIQGTL